MRNCWICRFREAAPILLEGLSKLEYRGYDSAGIAVEREEEGGPAIEVIKAKGRPPGTDGNDGQRKCCPGLLRNRTYQMGHTRRALCGERPSAFFQR